MKKSSQSQAALSLALGMSLLASAAASLPAFAETHSLFQLNEAQPLQIAEDKDAKTSCGAASCGAKKDKKCGSKVKKHHHKCGASKKCASKGNETTPPAKQ